MGWKLLKQESNATRFVCYRMGSGWNVEHRLEMGNGENLQHFQNLLTNIVPQYLLTYETNKKDHPSPSLSLAQNIILELSCLHNITWIKKRAYFEIQSYQITLFSDGNVTMKTDSTNTIIWTFKMMLILVFWYWFKNSVKKS